MAGLTQKIKTFRVSGVPTEWEKNDLLKHLKGATVRTLASEYHGKSQTAIVKFKEDSDKTKSISGSGVETGSWALEIDEHFHGMTTLHIPPIADHKVDVVAVSGLGGHAFGSFKERGGDYMWICDELPKWLAEPGTGSSMARVMIYGHESKVPESSSAQVLANIAETFRDTLRMVLKPSRNSPIILIGHSLGGLIIKQCLILLFKSSRQEDKALLDAVSAIVFFGTPHRGMEARRLIAMTNDGPNQELVMSLSSSFPSFLRELQRDFEQLFTGNHINSEVFCYYETELSPTAEWNEKEGRWKLDGPKAMLVDQDSATAARPGQNAGEYESAINRTHSEMVKFEKDDLYGTIVLGKLQELCTNALRIQVTENPARATLRMIQQMERNVEQAIETTESLNADMLRVLMTSSRAQEQAIQTTASLSTDMSRVLMASFRQQERRLERFDNPIARKVQTLVGDCMAELPAEIPEPPDNPRDRKEPLEKIRKLIEKRKKEIVLEAILYTQKDKKNEIMSAIERDALFNLAIAKLLSLDDYEFGQEQERVLRIIRRFLYEFHKIKDKKLHHIGAPSAGTYDWLAWCDPNHLERLHKESCPKLDICNQNYARSFPRQKKESQVFANFLKDDLEPADSTYMIVGLPGSGKSTLMKYLTQSEQVKENLTKWARRLNKTLIHARFFFSILHNLMCRDTMWRDIILQIIQHHPETTRDLFGNEDRAYGVNEPGSEEIRKVVENIFNSGEHSIKTKYCICLFIDGLDEFRRSPTSDHLTQSNTDILALMEELRTCCGRGVSVKLVMSCRPIAGYIPELLPRPRLQLHKHTKQDILHSLLRKPERIGTSNINFAIYEKLCPKMTDASNGVFIWADLVAEKVLDGLVEGKDEEELKQSINGVSNDLNKLYGMTLERVKRTDRPKAAVLFYLAVFKPEGFVLNMVVYKWLDRLKEPLFPMDEAVPSSVTCAPAGGTMKGLGVLSANCLIAKGRRFETSGRHPIPEATFRFFSTEITFFHRSVAEYVKALMDEKEDTQGPEWLMNQREAILKSISGKTGLIDPFLRILVAEMRYGVERKDYNGKRHHDDLDFGFWGEIGSSISQKRLLDVGNVTELAHSYRAFYAHFEGGRASFIGSNWPIGVDLEQWFVFGQLQMTLSWAMYYGFRLNIVGELPGRRIGRALGARLAIISAIRMNSEVLKWLLKSRCTTPRRTLSVFKSESSNAIMDDLRRNFGENRGHGIEDCTCGFREDSCISELGVPTPIWLITLRIFGAAARSARLAPLARKDHQDQLELWQKLLGVWLSESEPSDAVFIVAADENELKRKENMVNHEALFYVEIEQLWDQFRKVVGKSTESRETELLRKKLKGLRRPNLKEWFVKVMHKVVGRPGTRSRYRHMSDAMLCKCEWAVYGVVSRSSDLLGNFHCQMAV